MKGYRNDQAYAWVMALEILAGFMRTPCDLDSRDGLEDSPLVIAYQQVAKSLVCLNIEIYLDYAHDVDELANIERRKAWLEGLGLKVRNVSQGDLKHPERR